MKKLVYLAVILSAAFLTSCVVSKKVVPMVHNTVNTVDFDELNLKRNDYTILKNVTAEAVIAYKGPTTNDNRRYISEQNGEFSIAFYYNTGRRFEPFWVDKIDGVLCFGYLSNDHENMSLSLDPEYYSRHIAFYRLINQCRAAGGDALIAPVVDTSIEQQGDNTIYKTTVTAKVVKINTDK
ncbi:MAG: hypothetical protein KBT67_03385 [bacterium]|nr:hypothetical protein [Candidatus Limimorpha caballi]